MGIFKRILGICETRPPADSGCWSFADGAISVDLSRAEELRAAGGAIRLEGRELPDRFLVVSDGDGAFRAFRNRCTHMGRRLDPLGDSGKLRCCSVSRSTYDHEGTLQSGPTKGSLKACRVVVAENRLSIDPA